MSKFIVEYWPENENNSKMIEINADNFADAHKHMETYKADYMIIIEAEKESYGLHGGILRS